MVAAEGERTRMDTSVTVILVGAGVCLAVVLAAAGWLVLGARREVRRIERGERGERGEREEREEQEG